MKDKNIEILFFVDIPQLLLNGFGEISLNVECGHQEFNCKDI